MTTPRECHRAGGDRPRRGAALREVVALAARRRDLLRLTAGDLPDLEDEEVMRAAWRQ
jgi:hypothetical protein